MTRPAQGAALPPGGHALLTAVLDRLPVAAYTCDAGGHLTHFNPPAHLLWGRTPRLNHPEDRYCGSHRLYSAEGEPIRHDECWMALTLKTGQDHAGRAFFLERPDGRRVAALAHASPFRDEGGALTGAVNVLVEVGGRDDEARQAEKLEGLALLAGGVAHNLNNLLTAILGYANLAALEVPPGSSARPLLSHVERAAERAADLTAGLLAFSGRGVFVARPFRLDGLVRETAALLRAASGRAVPQLELEPAAVEGDSARVRQLLLALVANAGEALGGGPGTLAVRTGTLRLADDALRSPYLRPDPAPGVYACLEVADDGCGMSPETLERMFDPFFSTKCVGRGLSLAAVLGIVRGHRGTVQVASAPGRGTTVRVLFPAAGGAGVPSPPLAPPP